MVLSESIRKTVFEAQKNEITEHFIYKRLSHIVKDPSNKEALKHISDDELRHYHVWKKYTKEDVKPNKLKVWKYFMISRILGLTFGTKLMESGEKKAQINYETLSRFIPEAGKIKKDEQQHEHKLICLINEERLKYIGSVVLGLNDALVELTGAMAGFTLALQNSRLVALTGLITGVAASLSMSASEYLSAKTEKSKKDPIKSSVYTGIAYILTVMFLISPYFIFKNVYFSLCVTIFNAILVIFLFTFYISVAQEISFKRRFFEMVAVSLGVTALTFCIGLIIKNFLNVGI